MTWSEIEESDRESWLFEVTDGHGMDAPQAAKKKIADENPDIRYRDLRARKVNKGGLGPEYIAVVNVYGL